MSATPLENTDRLCVHTITTKPWPIEVAADKYAEAGIKGITVWRDTLEGRDIAKTGDRLRANGLKVVSLCRGGFFPATDPGKKQKAIDDNRKAIEEAAELGTDLIVLVCGAVPGLSLSESRKQIQAGIEKVLPEAQAAKVRLGIEPLHPMYADSRSAINTMEQANDLCAAIDSPYVGVAADVYHLWWDPFLEREIGRCGDMNKLFAFHVCDWRCPTVDMLLDRGLMGDGCIPIRQIRQWVEATGFKGFNEVEIFSSRHWAEDQDDFLQRIVNAYLEHV